MMTGWLAGLGQIDVNDTSGPASSAPSGTHAPLPRDRLARTAPLAPKKTHASDPVARPDLSNPSKLLNCPKSTLRPPPLRRVDHTKLAPVLRAKS